MARKVSTRKKSKAPATTFNVVIERDEDGWYVGSVLELPGCHTQAKSLDELVIRVREAIKACLPDMPAGNMRQFVGVQRMAV
jgi:predicted RNase H-like HicB family nuclease